MKISKTGLDFIKGFEGFVPFPYDDKVYPYREWKGEPLRGTATIGYGHTNSAKHPLRVKPGIRVTKEQATEILDVDLDAVEKDVNEDVKVPISQGQFDALVSFTYNCGEGNLLKLITGRLNSGNYNATRSAFDLYVHSGGEYMKGLQRRRDGEQALWDSNPVVIPDEPTGIDHPEHVDAPHPIIDFLYWLIEKIFGVKV